MNEICTPCSKHKNKQFAATSTVTKKNMIPAKLKALISLTSPNRLKLRFQECRVNTKELQLEMHS